MSSDEEKRISKMIILAETFLKKLASKPEAQNPIQQINWGDHPELSSDEKNEFPKWAH